MYDYRKLLRKRLIICITYAAILLFFVLGTICVDHYIRNKKQAECDQATQADFYKMVNEVCAELNRCKLPAVNLVQQLQDDPTFNFQNEEQVYAVLEQLLHENKILSGAIMGFQDWVYPQYAHHYGFGPLVRRNDSAIVRMQLGEIRDYRTENDWYQRQLQDPIAEWSKPFLSDDNEMIATYTIPLFKDKRYMGGLGIDIDLSRFANHIDSLRPYASSIVVVVDAELNILIHPNRSYIGTTRLPEAMERVGIKPENHPMHHSKERQSGVDYDYLGQRRMAFYYAPITETNWMLLLYCNTDEIYAPMKIVHNIVMIFAIIGVLFITALLGISIYRYTRDYVRIRQYGMI